MDNKEAIDIILKTIQLEMAELIRKHLVSAYELGKSTGAVEALEAIKKDVDNLG
jgi:hypothetical protein